MFSKRRRAASNPPQRAPPSASASLAAAKAFVNNQESHPNLSNAAAAAALRTHVTTPPPVGDTVTKRMLRRSSQSSNSSGQVPQRPGVLQRQTSSGSMTERTFRSPSPGRGSPADTNAPPVPAMPKQIADAGATHRRASSLEPPYRGGSPASRGGGRGVSLDRGTAPSTGGRGQRATSNLAQVLEDDQDGGSRSSVNFSRPMSPAAAAKQNAAPQSGWFGGPRINQEAVQRMVSTSSHQQQQQQPQTAPRARSMDLHNAQQTVQNAADRPVKTHQVARGVEGSKLSSGSMRAKPAGTAVESRSFLPASKPPAGPVDPKSPDAVFDPSTRTFVHKQAAMAMHRELHEEPEQPAHHYVAQHVEEHSPRHAPQQRLPPRTPSPVRQPARREEPAAVQRREEALPKIDTSAKIRRPEDSPTGIPSAASQAKAAFEQEQVEEFADADIESPERADNSVQPTHIDVMVSPEFAQNQDSSYPRLPTPVVPTTTSTLAGQGQGSVRTSTDRGHSLSPPRNAHFAPVAVELAGVKHQPPPRSSSPAKSALKSSPSVSRRGTSPVSQNGRLSSRGAPSETSDTTSDGGSGKKKRPIRVSFEETPLIAGTTPKTVAETPTPSTGLGASKWSPITEKDNEFEDFMKPRPALPSFGSVRGKERRLTPDEAEKVTETVSSTPMTASVGSIGEPLHASSDHAIAGIVTQDLAKKQTATNDPLPPEVTSVEGSGYVSDSSDEGEGTPGLQKHGAADESSQVLPVPEPKSLTAPHEEKPVTPASIKDSVVDVPEIALLPATPSPYEKPEPRYQSLMIPGGWGDDDVPEPEHKASGTSATTSAQKTQPIAATQPTQQPTTLHELVTRDDDSSDDNSSIYSDAYEDISDAEGGYGSIDAVANSPVATSSSGLMFSKYSEKSAAEPTSSGLRNETLAQDVPSPVTTPGTDWNATQQHWSGLNEARKQPQQDVSPVAQPSRTDNLEKDRTVTAPLKQKEIKPERKIEPQPMPVQKTPSTPSMPQAQTAQPASKPLKSALKKAPTPEPAPAAQSQPHIRKTMRGPPPVQRDDRAVPQMRTTMRGPPGRDARPMDSQMRTSMRTGAYPPPRDQAQLRTSMRGASPAAVGGAGLAASRHSMTPIEQKQPRGALQKKHIPAKVQAANVRPQGMPVAPAKRVAPVAPVPTYDSDSDASASSFQKARGRRSGNQGGRYTMRASMRQDDVPTMRGTAPAPKPIRSISPPGSPTPVIRKSMRPSSPTPEAPKSSRFSIRSLSPMGRFRSSKPIEPVPPMPTQPRQVTGLSKQPKQKAPAPQRTKPAFSSRFADSSDEDEDSRPSRFQSRFADSDDDEPGDYTLPPGLAPVRGIPRKAGEEDGDSTDLEEELDEPAPSTAANKEIGSTTTTNGAGKDQTNGATNGQGAILATGSLRDSKHAALPSFEGGGKVKAKRGFFGLGKKKASAAPTTTAQSTGEPTSPSRPTVAPSSEIPLPPQQANRSQAFPLTPIDEDKNFDTPNSPLGTSPQSNKAPKLQRRSTPEWPLPHNNIPVPPIPDDTRPMSSDGITPRRPRFANRQTSTMSSATAPDAPGRSVSYGRSGKKKKFQGLRRVFGLND